MTTINNLTKHDSRAFKVGDYVFHTIAHRPRLERITWTDGMRIMTDIANGSAPVNTFIHATDEEIKSGHRLEAERHG